MAFCVTTSFGFDCDSLLRVSLVLRRDRRSPLRDRIVSCCNGLVPLRKRPGGEPGHRKGYNDRRRNSHAGASGLARPPHRVRLQSRRGEGPQRLAQILAESILQLLSAREQRHRELQMAWFLARGRFVPCLSKRGQRVAGADQPGHFGDPLCRVGPDPQERVMGRAQARAAFQGQEPCLDEGVDERGAIGLAPDEGIAVERDDDRERFGGHRVGRHIGDEAGDESIERAAAARPQMRHRVVGGLRDRAGH